MALNKRIRFMANNFAELISASVVYSSELSSFPGTNAQNKFRSRVWKPQGYFEITTSNHELYINDGSDKTVSITVGEYTSGSALATQIQTDLNAASSNWTVTYDSTSTYKFTISNSGSVTLRFSQTTDAIWDTIGYTGSSDTTGTSFVADAQRNHTEEHVIFDLGYQDQMEFFAVIGPLDEVFGISKFATITLEANNLNQWDSPPLQISLSLSDNGIFKFLEDATGATDYSYRYWKLKIVDKTNSDGPSGFSIGHIYLGTFQTITQSNVSRNFSKNVIDPSKISVSESGANFFDVQTKYHEWSSLNINYLDKTERLDLEQFFFDVGKNTPFYISLDPQSCVSEDLDELTKYVVFKDMPEITHVHSDMYSVSFTVKELV